MECSKEDETVRRTHPRDVESKWLRPKHHNRDISSEHYNGESYLERGNPHWAGAGKGRRKRRKGTTTPISRGVCQKRHIRRPRDTVADHGRVEEANEIRKTTYTATQATQRWGCQS